jgi:hypothetical protein
MSYLYFWLGIIKKNRNDSCLQNHGIMRYSQISIGYSVCIVIYRLLQTLRKEMIHGSILIH